VTARQLAWRRASDESAARGEGLAAGMFALLSLPNEREGRGHSCREHALGFRTAKGRRGFRCGICREVVKWVDPEVTPCG
jgi:hypothetical protein